ncbi:MAG: redoxin domain-containing protein [Chloroflexota bacterium]
MPEINQPAPDFELPDLEGGVHRLSDFRGRIVIVSFWSAECPQVQRVDKLLVPSLAGWGGEVALLPVAANANEPLEALENASITRGLPIVLHDAEGQVADLYEAVTTPHVFVIGRDGILRYRGAFDNVTFRQRQATQSYLADAVAALLDGRLPNPAETQPYGCAIVRQ